MRAQTQSHVSSLECFLPRWNGASSHSYIPETILSDLGTTFVSELFHEFTKLLEVQLKQASLKHPQTVGVVERSHSALKQILKLQTNEHWNDWYKYVPLAAFIQTHPSTRRSNVALWLFFMDVIQSHH